MYRWRIEKKKLFTYQFSNATMVCHNVTCDASLNYWANDISWRSISESVCPLSKICITEKKMCCPIFNSLNTITTIRSHPFRNGDFFNRIFVSFSANLETKYRYFWFLNCRKSNWYWIHFRFPDEFAGFRSSAKHRPITSISRWQGHKTTREHIGWSSSLSLSIRRNLHSLWHREYTRIRASHPRLQFSGRSE